MKELDPKYAEFNDIIFCKLLDSRTKLLKSRNNNWQYSKSENLRHLAYVFANENEIMEEIWKEWENVYYHEK